MSQIGLILVSLAASFLIWKAAMFWGRFLLNAEDTPESWISSGLYFVVGYSLLIVAGATVPLLAPHVTGLQNWLLVALIGFGAGAGWLKRSPPRAPASPAESVIVAGFLALIAICYLPTAAGLGQWFRFPPVYDLPKHIAVFVALAASSGAFPVASPYVPDAIFAYNYGFYLPLALLARFLHAPETTFVILPLFMLVVAWAAISLVGRCAERIRPGRHAGLAAILMLTFIGGITPLLVGNLPPTGQCLLLRGLVTQQVWMDEFFQSAIYVPQHIFSVLAAIAGVLCLHEVSSTARRLSLFALTVAAGCHSSYIMAPYCVGFGLTALCLRAFFAKPSTGWLCRANVAGLLAAALLLVPVALALVQARGWLGNSGGHLLAMPACDRTWFYFALSAALPALLGAIQVGRLAGRLPGIILRRDRSAELEASLLMGVPLVLAGVLFFHFPDGGIKGAIFLRILLAIAAAPVLTDMLDCRWVRKPLILTSICAAGVCLLLINLMTVFYFLRSSHSRRPASQQALIQDARAVPLDWWILFPTADQETAAAITRKVIFDAHTSRPDFYIPASDRKVAFARLAAFLQLDPQTLGQYAPLIAQVVLPIDAAWPAHPDFVSAGVYEELKLYRHVSAQPAAGKPNFDSGGAVFVPWHTPVVTEVTSLEGQGSVISDRMDDSGWSRPLTTPRWITLGKKLN